MSEALHELELGIECSHWLSDKAEQALDNLAALGPDAVRAVPMLQDLYRLGQLNPRMRMRLAYTLYRITGDREKYLTVLLRLVVDPMADHWDRRETQRLLAPLALHDARINPALQKASQLKERWEK